MSESTPIKEIAIEGTHETVTRIVREELPDPVGIAVLDFGAGHGALTQRLQKAGYAMCACDYYPENFHAEGVECRKSDDTLAIPFEDARFDLVVAVELLEHVDGHRRFFEEVFRVLKPGGKLLFTTPNILSLKSRMLFLLTGYFYSFRTLDPEVFDPVHQHISPFSLDRYRFMLKRCGLELHSLRTDAYQNTSIFLMLLWPLVRLETWRQYRRNPRAAQQNSLTTLLGRKLVLVAAKPTH